MAGRSRESPGTPVQPLTHDQTWKRNQTHPKPRRCAPRDGMDGGMGKEAGDAFAGGGGVLRLAPWARREAPRLQTERGSCVTSFRTTHACSRAQPQARLSLPESPSSPWQQQRGPGQGWAWGPGAWLLSVSAHSCWLEGTGQELKIKALWVRHSASLSPTHIRAKRAEGSLQISTCLHPKPWETLTSLGVKGKVQAQRSCMASLLVLLSCRPLARPPSPSPHFRGPALLPQGLCRWATSSLPSSQGGWPPSNSCLLALFHLFSACHLP